MKRSPLVRRTPLRRSARRPRTSRKTRYAARPRAFGYMGWVKTCPCLLFGTLACSGPVEADHCGDRGLGQKSLDRDCVPLCTKHHRERTDVTGYFAGYDAATMRVWRHQAIDVTHRLAERCGVEVPDC